MANAYRQQAEALQQISASLQTAMSTIDKERAKQTKASIHSVFPGGFLISAMISFQ